MFCPFQSSFTVPMYSYLLSGSGNKEIKKKLFTQLTSNLAPKKLKLLLKLCA